MVVGNLIFLLPFWNFVFPVVLQVAFQLPALAALQVNAEGRPAALFPSLAKVRIPVVRLGKFLKDQKSCKTFNSGEASLKDCLPWISLEQISPQEEMLVVLTGSTLDRSSWAQYTSKPRWEYLDNRFSYDGERRVRSIWLI